ncbi:MAG: RES family NAD+ phosphorylase [Gammaproteobacteria bacterium]|nr:RES family NAD+ phosphorylase [Gammaproteobacteria bacterium]MYE83659.1 RES family NAD+ phosphorylase [Gammaproteobacteria bacterium]
MFLWRLSAADHAERFDGGYGMLYDGRWNTRGRPITYCASGPAVCVLERLVHIKDASALPDDTMVVQYDVPEDIALDIRPLEQLPPSWRTDADGTRSIGDAWLDGVSAPLLVVPSAVVPVARSNDRNILVNHRHPDAGRIAITRIEPFEFDPRLFEFA